MEQELIKYKQAFLKRRIIRIALLVVIIVGYFFASAIAKQPSAEHIAAFLNGFHAGTLGAFIGIAIGLAILTIRTARSPERLKKQYIKEKDERNILIRYKAMTITCLIVFLALYIAVLASSFFGNITVYCTLLAVLFFFMFVLFTSFAWYRSKH